MLHLKLVRSGASSSEFPEWDEAAENVTKTVLIDEKKRDLPFSQCCERYGNCCDGANFAKHASMPASYWNRD